MPLDFFFFLPDDATASRIEEVAALLPLSPELRIFKLGACALDVRSAAALGEGLARAPSLEHLILANRLDQEEGSNSVIASALKDSALLREFTLEVGLTLDAAATLAQALAKTKVMRRVNFTYRWNDPPSDEAMAVLAQSLGKMD